ncbi:MAG: hypothetical protein AAF687_12940 [Pseudomonadota bacterium]
MFRSKVLGLGIVATLGLTGCSDANTYPFPLVETKKRLSNQKSTYLNGEHVAYLSTKGAHGSSVMVEINTPTAYTRSECMIKLEEVDRENTRLVPECGTSGNEHKQKKYRIIEERIAKQARIILLGEEALEDEG